MRSTAQPIRHDASGDTLMVISVLSDFNIARGSLTKFSLKKTVVEAVNNPPEYEYKYNLQKEVY